MWKREFGDAGDGTRKELTVRPPIVTVSENKDSKSLSDSSSSCEIRPGRPSPPPILEGSSSDEIQPISAATSRLLPESSSPGEIKPDASPSRRKAPSTVSRDCDKPPSEFGTPASREKLLEDVVRKQTPTNETIRLDLLHPTSKELIAGKFDGHFEGKLIEATYLEKRAATKRAGRRRRRHFGKVREAIDKAYYGSNSHNK